VTLAEISRSIQRSAFSIQTAQQFGAVSTGILPSKDAKAKEAFSIQHSARVTVWRCFRRHPSQPGCSCGNQNLEPQRTPRSAEENFFAADLH
jgi:hypothetical protein